MWTFWIVALSAAAIVCCSAEIGSYDYDNKIEESGSNDRDNLTSNVYVLPEQIFNDGKPFYVHRDETGSIDFNAKTTPESLPTPTDATSNSQTNSNAVNSTKTDVNTTHKHDISLDKTVQTQNIHDFLNLPVKYQSSKFVYPLVSSSYANLKYQGNNKNYISNHKYDSSTAKSVAYTTKKYKTTYPPKAYTTSSFATKGISTTTTPTTAAGDSSESSTKASQANGTRKYSNIPPRSSTPGRRYSTPGRVSSTTARNSLSNSDIKYTRGRSTTTTTTTVTPTPSEKLENPAVTPSSASVSTVSSVSSTTTISSGGKVKNATENEDSMFGDFFSYFFNNEESEESEATRLTTKATPSTTVLTLRPTLSTTNVPIQTKESDKIKPFSSRYNMTMDPSTRKPNNRTATTPEINTTARTTEPIGDRIATASTAEPAFTEYGDKTSVNTGKFRPPTNVNNIRVSPGAQTASFVTNGQVSAGFNGIRPYNEQNVYKGQFQPPAQNNMNSIVVLPDSNSAAVVATSQLQTTTHLDQKLAAGDYNRRPVPIPNVIDETTKPGITFIAKGQVTSAEAYDNPNQNNIIFHGPSSNSNNIVIAPGTKTAAFVTSSQMSMSVDKTAVQDQTIKSVENGINAYGMPLQSATQRPHGFVLASTTSIPKPINSVVIAQTVKNETQQHVRFPSENVASAQTEGAGVSIVEPESVLPSAVDNTIKFPTNQEAAQVQPLVMQTQQMPQVPSDGLVKFADAHNEIVENIEQNYKHIIQNPNIPGPNFVVFRPQLPPMQMQQPPLVMVPPIIRSPPFVFKKPSFVQYPRKNHTLPNILPQFRPQPQPQQQMSISPEMANQLRQGQINRAQYLHHAQNLRYKPQLPFMFGQRPMQIRPSIDQTQNRRHFELHPGNYNQLNQLNQRIYEQRPVLPHMFNRNAIGANALLVEPQRFEENMKVTATNGNMDSSKNHDFENGDGKLISVQPIVESQQKEIPKVEPVTTLQMIQQRLLQKTGAVAVNGLPLQMTNRNATAIDANGKTEKPLYVVYPMQKTASVAGLNSNSNGNINNNNNNQRGNGEIATILAEQMHKPATIQQLGLPYSLEKHKSRYILNSRPAYEFEKKSDQQDPIAAENDEEDR